MKKIILAAILLLAICLNCFALAGCKKQAPSNFEIPDSGYDGSGGSSVGSATSFSMCLFLMWRKMQPMMMFATTMMPIAMINSVAIVSYFLNRLYVAPMPM